MESVMRTLYRGLVNRGHEVKIILFKESRNSSWEQGLPVYHVASEVTGDPKKDALLLRELLDKMPIPDIIIALDAWQTAAAKYAIENVPNRSRVISWLHISPHTNPNSSQEKEYLSCADAHLAISDGIRQQLESLTPQIPIHLLYNPVHIVDNLISRSQHPTFLYVGRIVKIPKRIDKILQTFSRITGEWELHLIGDGKDSELFREMAEKLGIMNKVQWHGWHDDPWSVINAATALILASDYEAFPLSIIEALSRGLPVISSDCKTGPAEIIKNGVNGWLFRPEDTDSFKNILENIVNGTLKLPDQQSCKASVSAFEESIVIDKYERVLLDISKKKSDLSLLNE
jgi:UDP-D-galactose:(glucosyl)LPS alpha-1,6-D-galactosyltransferase